MLAAVLTAAGIRAGLAETGTNNRSASHQAGAEQTADIPSNQRLLSLNNTINTRDLGGYKAADGRTVKWGVLFRSDSLANLDESDLGHLEALALSTVTDLRSDSERAEAPDRLPQQSPPIGYRTLAVNDPAVDVADLGRKFYAGQLSQSELVALTDRRSYINDTALSRQWGQWVRSLADPGALPQLFHCTAGKDRTGFAAAIVLLTLGVSKDDVMSDFLLSNHYLSGKIARSVEQIQARYTTEIDTDLLRELIGVTPTSLNGAIEAMEAKYGSIDGYIEHGLGIDTATRLKLRDLLLE